jgi:hypothetical protein
MGAFGRLCYRLFLPWVDGLVSVSESTMPATRKPAAVGLVRRATDSGLLLYVEAGDDARTYDAPLPATPNQRFQPGLRLRREATSRRDSCSKRAPRGRRECFLAAARA